MKSATKKSAGKNAEILVIGRRKVTVTNQQKIFWPEEKITKGDVLRYYQSIAKFILPYLKNRPQSLKRNPGGIYDKGFFQKNAGHQGPEWLKSKILYSESAERDIDYILCNDSATLAYLNNLGCIELNPWHSTVSKTTHPDYLIIDIDPSEKNSFDQVVETAQVVRDILARAKTKCYCKTSGSTGLHVYVPAAKKYSYDQLKDFAELICTLTMEQLPGFTTLERNLRKRGKRHIYLDHLQNRQGQTISSVFSLRPKPGAPVSMPLKWAEVKPGLDPLQFNIHNAAKQIARRNDLFKPVLGAGFNLAATLKILDI